MSKRSKVRKEEPDFSDNPLIPFFEQIYPLEDEVKQFICDNTFQKNISRGKYLLKPGEICNHYYYIHKGLLRAYIKFGSKEITTWINNETTIVTSIRSMSVKEPSREYIQALEDTQVIGMHADKMEEIYTRFPQMNLVGRLLLQQYYSDAEERSFLSKIPNAEIRYKHFVNTRPELQNRISLKYVASYLGITIETLSRLRSKKSI